MIKNIGRYRILEELGQGAMAIVYKAHDPEINRTLAIKVLRKEKCIDGEYRKRFLRESRAAGNLSHPNIVTIYDVGEFDDQPYIVMELLPGTPLDRIMKSDKVFTRNEIISIGIQLATALDYAHNHGVVHRDIKPSNIVCSFSLDGIAKLKITDFGIAHIEDTSITQQTQLGEILGTPLYMSPEQVLGQTIDGRSDLFSMGVILYQLSTGEKPFTGNSVTTLLFQIATEDPVPITQIIDNFPTGLKQIIDSLLKKQPDKRFQSGKELVIALNAVSGNNNATIKKARSRIMVPIRIKWTATIGLVILVVLLIGMSLMYKKQEITLVEQLQNYGISMVKVLSTESAELILSQDWISVELLVDEIASRQEFEYLSIIDHQNIIRGHSLDDYTGKSFVETFAETIATPVKTVSDISVNKEVFNGHDIFSFNAPVMFQNKQIGKINLGLSRQDITRSMNSSLQLMGLILAISMSAALFIAYLISNALTYPIMNLKQAMESISSGDLDYRIGQKRNDEFRQVYSSFNDMADSIAVSIKNNEETILRKDDNR